MMIDVVHLFWIIPGSVLLGISVTAMWFTHDRNAKAEYAKFDADMKVGYDPAGNNMGVAYYRPGDPPGTYDILLGSDLHRRAEKYQEQLLNDTGKTWPQHTGLPCSASCWRKPEGHRWADEQDNQAAHRDGWHGLD